MENSETQTRIINLGRNLVEKLGLDHFDSLAQWMAHYIAEQIVDAENLTGDEKIKAEHNCFETILKLWHNRSSLPDGTRPFESFEPIFRFLSRLDPENPNPYYYSFSNYRSSKQDNSDEEPNEVQQWLDYAEGIDRVARVLLEFVFFQAALNAKDDKTISWLENAVGLPDSDDISIILKLIDAESDDEIGKDDNQRQQVKREKLEKRIDQLDAFVEFSRHLRDTLMSELEALT